MDVSGIVSYLAGFVIMAGIYAVFALGLNVHWGFTGLFNIGIAGFFALGAYTTALLTTQPPDPNLFEDFKFGGNWSGLPFLDLGIDLWFFLGLGAAAGGVWDHRPAYRLGHPAAARRLPGDSNPGNSGDGSATLPQREVARQRVQGLVPDTQIPG